MKADPQLTLCAYKKCSCGKVDAKRVPPTNQSFIAPRYREIWVSPISLQCVSYTTTLQCYWWCHWPVTHKSSCSHSNHSTFWIFTVTQISQNLVNCNKLCENVLLNKTLVSVSQGSAVMRLRCGVVDLIFTAEFAGERLLKTGQHLAKLWPTAEILVFLFLLTHFHSKIYL